MSVENWKFKLNILFLSCYFIIIFGCELFNSKLHLKIIFRRGYDAPDIAELNDEPLPIVVEKSKKTVEYWLTGKPVYDAQRPDQIPKAELPPCGTSDFDDFYGPPKDYLQKPVKERSVSSSSTSSSSSRQRRKKQEEENLSKSSSDVEEEYFESELGYLKPEVNASGGIEYYLSERAAFSPELFYILPMGESVQAEVVELATLSEEMEKHFKIRSKHRIRNWIKTLSSLPVGTLLATYRRGDVRFV